MIFKCKICGGDLDVSENVSIGTCQYCDSTMTLPRLDDDKRLNLYNRANHFRRNNEYDKALGIYESILNEHPSDAEAYWSIVLCKYGVEYVEDPKTHRHMPTCNRTQYTPIYADENYKAAITGADAGATRLYEEEAKLIDEIQKGILEISAKEKPFDIFICYKENDNNGRRTPDSVLAQDLYFQLTQEKFNVFFSRITLEDKLGNAYEPYIFAALNSAKVMVAVGTRPEHFNAAWVKNEWSRYLALIKEGAKKTLIPAYKDMDPYELPDEFSHLQAQDMGKLGFMQDLIRGIRKIAAPDDTKAAAHTYNEMPAGVPLERLIKNGQTYLELGEYPAAKEAYKRATGEFPEDYRGWWGLILCASNDLTELNRYSETIGWYQNVVKLAKDDDISLLKERYQEYMHKANITQLNKQIETADAEIKNLTKRKNESESEFNRDIRYARDKKESAIQDAGRDLKVTKGPIICLVIGLFILIIGIFQTTGSGGTVGIPMLIVGGALSIPFCISASSVKSKRKTEKDKAALNIENNIKEITARYEKQVEEFVNSIENQKRIIQSHKDSIQEIEEYIA